MIESFSRVVVVVLVFLAASSSGGCRPQGSERPFTAHPDERYRVRPPIAFGRGHVGPGEPADQKLPVRLAFDSVQTVDRLPDLGQPRFGRIADVAIAGDGRIHILDDRLSAISVFTPEGRLLQRFGRPGTIAGELAGPLSLTVDGGSRLYVGSLDHFVSIFEYTDGGYQFVKRLEVDFAPRSICTMQQILFVSGAALHSPYAIVSYDLDGRKRAAFGKAYASPNRLVNQQLQYGRLVCDASSNLVILATATALGEIRAYKPSGQSVWGLQVEGLRPIRLIDTPGGGYALQVPEGSYHRTQTLLLLRAGLLLAQYALVESRSSGSPPKVKRVDSLLLNSGSGAILYRTTHLPPLSAANGELAVTAFGDPRDPLPRAVLWKWREW